MRYAKLALATFIGLWAFVGIVACAVGVANYWMVCHSGTRLQYGEAAARHLCVAMLPSVLLAVGLTLLASAGTYLTYRYRGRRWLPHPGRWRAGPHTLRTKN